MSGGYRAPRRPVASGVGAALATALLLGVPLVQHWEGLRLTPYRDPVGIATVCYGETGAAMRRYSADACNAMLKERFQRDYLRPIARCVPTLPERPAVWAASGSLAYNIGVGAFCRSRAASLFRAGRWREGCEAFGAWNRAGGRVLSGLIRRRAAERALCLSGAAQ